MVIELNATSENISVMKQQRDSNSMMNMMMFYGYIQFAFFFLHAHDWSAGQIDIKKKNIHTHKLMERKKRLRNTCNNS